MIRSSAPCVRAALAALASVLAAQEPTAPTTPKPVERAPVVHISIGGPAVWRAQLAPTNVGSLLASNAGRGLWEPMVQPFEQMLQHMVGFDDPGYAASRARLLDYGGHLEVSLAFPDEGEPEATFCLRPDGKTDLKALAVDVTHLLEKTVGRAWQVGRDGVSREMPLDQVGVVVAEPQLRSECIVAAVGTPERIGALLQRAAPAAAAAPEPKGAAHKRPVFALQVDTAAAVAALLEREPREADGYRAAGLASLERTTIELAAAGPHVSLQVAQTFCSDDRGLFAAFFPTTKGVPAIAALRPQPDVAWKAGRFDVRALIDAVIAMVVTFDQRSEEEVRKEIGEHLGDLETGFLSHFTDEHVLFGTTDLVLGDEDSFLTWGMVFRIRDAEKFLPKWNDARKELGMTELEEETVDGGFRVQRLGGWFQTTALIGPDVFAIAYGPDARARIDQIVAAAAKSEWQKTAAAPEAFQPALRHQPPGLNGIAEGNIAVLVGQVGLALQLLGELVGGLPDLDGPGLDADGKEQLQKLLTEHHLITARSMTGFADRRWCFRLLW